MESNLSIVKDKFKELPNNIEAEQAVIGSILVSNDIFDEINIIISMGKELLRRNWKGQLKKFYLLGKPRIIIKDIVVVTFRDIVRALAAPVEIIPIFLIRILGFHS